MERRWSGVLAVAAVAAALCPACGRRGPIRPPELIAPAPIASLAARAAGDGVVLEWKRPTTHIDGSRLTDLGGFYVERAAGTSLAFARIATVPVTDRERFKRMGRFRFNDRGVKPGTRYRYRVVSFTVDRYASRPSNEVELTVSVEEGSHAGEQLPAGEKTRHPR